MFNGKNKMANRSRQGKTRVSEKSNITINTSDKRRVGPRWACKENEHDELMLSTHLKETKANMSEGTKSNPGIGDEIRRSSRRHSGKSALELLGISPRKPRGQALKSLSKSEPSKSVSKDKIKGKEIAGISKNDKLGTQVKKLKSQHLDHGGSETSGLDAKLDTQKRITRKVSQLIDSSQKHIPTRVIELQPVRKAKSESACVTQKKTEPNRRTTCKQTDSTAGCIQKKIDKNILKQTKEGNSYSLKIVTPTTVGVQSKPIPLVQPSPKPQVTFIPTCAINRDSSSVISEKRKASTTEDEPVGKHQKLDEVEKEAVVDDNVADTNIVEDLPPIIKILDEPSNEKQDTTESTSVGNLRIIDNTLYKEELPAVNNKIEEPTMIEIKDSDEVVAMKRISATETSIIKSKKDSKVTKGKKIVKAIVITPSGEKKEIKLQEGVSVVKALESILAGTQSGGVHKFDVVQLATDVNKQIEESMMEDEEVLLTETPPSNSTTEDNTHVIEVVPEGGGHFSTGIRIENIAGSVNPEHKMAYEALSQLVNSSPGGQPVVMALDDTTMVDMDWLQQQGLQVIVSEGDEDRWHRQALGVEDPPALAQVLNTTCTQRVRARPEKHLVASEDLQEMINRLQPDDNMANHIEWMTHDGQERKMHCKHCHVILRDKHQFRKHINQHKDEVEYKPWKCPICHYRAPVRAQIARHVNIHGELKPFICKECGKGFNFKQKLLLHLKYHLDIRDRYCPYCDLAFHEHKTLKNHLRKIHHVEHMTPELMAKVKVPWSEVQKRAAAAVGAGVRGIAARKAAETSTADKETSAAIATLPRSTSISVQLQPNQNKDNLPSEVADENVEKEATSAIDQPVVGPIKKSSHLYGTRKTFLYTQQYKLGLLPAADRNNVPISKFHGSEPSNQTAIDPQSIIEQKRQRLTIPKVTSTDQIEPVLNQYCNIERVNTVPGISQTRFFCKVCEIEPFTSKTGFIHHLEQKHMDIRAWQCSECNYTCRMRSSLIVHMKLHTGIKDYKCEVCNKAFAFKQKLKNHMKHHLNLREHHCHLCDKAFNEKNDLTKHIKKVHTSERDFICQVCQKGFKDQVQLRRHMEGHSNTRYLCEHCNKLYRSRVSLAQHMKCHTCMFHCEICDKNFGSYSGFMAHKVMHDESYEGYECTLCKKVLHTKGSLTRHLAISHSNDRPHACTECGKPFKTKKDLKNHHVVHETERRYKCEVCVFTCKRPESLRVHQRRHSEVKPFQCGVCGKDYTQKHALETHLRHHTGQVEGSCPICGREFFTRYQLDTHIRRKHQMDLGTDTEEHSTDTTLVEEPVTEDLTMTNDGTAKPMTVFMCEECNSVFMSQDSLAVHILAEHMKQGWLNGAPTTSGTIVPAAGESLLAPRILSPSVCESIVDPTVANTIDIITETDNVVAAAAAVDTPFAQRLSDTSFDGQQTIETLVSVSNPGSTKQRLVSLIHPVGSTPGLAMDSLSEGGVITIGESIVTEYQEEPATKEEEEETATQKLNALYEHHPEAYVSIIDPHSNQELLVAIPQSNFESLLAATEAGVEGSESFITPTADDYITVSTPGSADRYVTIASDITQPVGSVVAMSAIGLDVESSEDCGAVAETIEIPIESECVTILDDSD